MGLQQKVERLAWEETVRLREDHMGVREVGGWDERKSRSEGVTQESEGARP